MSRTTTRMTRLRHILLNHTDPSGIPIPQYIVAASCHITPSQLSNYALGREPIKHNHLLRLCEYFQVPPNSLLGYTTASDIIEWKEPQPSC